MIKEIRGEDKILTTLDETNGAPESTLYIFFDMNFDLWVQVRESLVGSNLISVSRSNYVTLTESGKVTAAKLNAAISH
jgi:hypothetical protein